LTSFLLNCLFTHPAVIVCTLSSFIRTYAGHCGHLISFLHMVPQCSSTRPTERVCLALFWPLFERYPVRMSVGTSTIVTKIFFRGSSVGIVTCCTDRVRFAAGYKFFSTSTTSRSALGLTQFLIQLLLGPLFPREGQSGKSVKLTIHFYLAPRSTMVELYLPHTSS
jgi:hypothetical protein